MGCLEETDGDAGQERATLRGGCCADEAAGFAGCAESVASGVGHAAAAAAGCCEG